MEGFVSEEKDLDLLGDREPVEFLENMGDVVVF